MNFWTTRKNQVLQAVSAVLFMQLSESTIMSIVRGDDNIKMKFWSTANGKNCSEMVF